MSLADARTVFAVPPFPRSRPHEVVEAKAARRPEPGEADALRAAMHTEEIGLAWLAPDPSVARIEEALLTGIGYRDPFTCAPTSPAALVRILGGWRRLIESNHGLAAAFGFARWKQDTVEPLLWNGTRAPPFRAATDAAIDALSPGARVAVWKARVSDHALARLEREGFELLEVEDGFIRSVGLGADCVPPLSIVLDDQGPHYDPSRPNRLEAMIERGGFDDEILARAAQLRQIIVENGIGKYAVGGAGASPPPSPDGRRRVLVPGQVEDDRSVLFGSREVTTNLALLERARAIEGPEAHITYRPHPDVTAGHRKGGIDERAALALADAIDLASPISALIGAADTVHVMTSLAGFEALLQNREVVTHGQPFYAGWGLTRDLAPPIPRRTAKRSLDELVAAVLLLYPRYLDPVTNLPCTPEILIMRLMAGVSRQNDALVPLRRLQGWIGRVLTRMSKTV